ncbi:hypothetical protein BDV36DRAFT_264033 [Aspergillus pseudocaelatus]|uniref:Uncharacterized protein n=1 Tax=Aspergillus pseudocaelatus TaxID=1825620 RepID=A0ABQ6WCS2_9EURO|nr:hypothetical protein BDV36DRAFT_264033 [Aspergillus pseudocaelatus]
MFKADILRMTLPQDFRAHAAINSFVTRSSNGNQHRALLSFRKDVIQRASWYDESVMSPIWTSPNLPVSPLQHTTEDMYIQSSNCTDRIVLPLQVVALDLSDSDDLRHISSMSQIFQSDLCTDRVYNRGTILASQ